MPDGEGGDRAPSAGAGEGSPLSRRLAWSVRENDLARLEEEVRATAPPGLFADLTVSNPTQVGLPFSEGALEEALRATAPGVATYAPEPRGTAQARAALLADLARRGVVVADDRLVLTSSTSEAYGYLFKLLADPGDVVLVPTPSYPLFEYLARLEGLTPVPYRSWYAAAAWHLDEESLEEASRQSAARGRRVAAVVAVSPNNPTGHWLEGGERDLLAREAARWGAALIVDEVFQDFALDGRSRSPAERCAASDAAAPSVLTFSLGGLSKSLGLPQIKLGWILVGGPTREVNEALRGLTLIADTYLSVSTPAQAAMPALLALGDARRAVISARLLRQRAEASALLAGSALSPLVVQGGWSLPLRVPSLAAAGLGSDDDWARAALLRHRTLTQPGFFFDLEGGPFLVTSLLSEPGAWSRGLLALRALADLI